MELMHRPEAWHALFDSRPAPTRMSRWLDLMRWPDPMPSRGLTDGEGEPFSIPHWSPPCDIVETEKAYLIYAELPNVEKNDVNITLDGKILTISGLRREEEEEKGKRFHRRELRYGQFVRRFILPEDVDPSNVEAKFEDGMLRITIARATEQTGSSKRIEVR